MSTIFNEIKESLTMAEVAEHLGYEVNRSGFIFSPFENEKTPSCKLYPRSFYDFSSGTGGDLIRFTSAVLGVNNWQACQHLIEAFHLPFSLSGSADNVEEIHRRQQEKLRQQVREQRFKAAWRAEVDRLKGWKQIYRRAIDEKCFPPHSTERRFCMEELQVVGHKLDALCGLIGGRAEQEEILREAGREL